MKPIIASRNKIVLSCTPEHGWVSTAYGPDGEERIRLFGSRTIQTAFTCRAPESMVLGEIRRLNPDAEVTVF